MPVLTAVDVVGIQRYVFGSNRLRDVVGASWLVDSATSTTGLLAGLLSPQNVLMAAGGNVIARFDGEQDNKEGRQFAALLTRRIHDDAPGLEVVIAHRPYKSGELARALRALQVDLSREKLERRPHAPLLGLGVTASCANTGLPAVDFDSRDMSAPLSNQALKMGDPALRRASTARWEKFIPTTCVDPDRFAFPDDLENLGASFGERSLLGIVHVDGNGIGNRIKKWLDECVNTNVLDAIVTEQYREWSSDLTELGNAALKAVMQRLFSAIENRVEPDGTVSCRIGGGRPQVGDGDRPLSFRLKENRSDKRTFDGDQGVLPACWLPIRPVLLGGDDLTFLCDGRLALDLAATALTAMELQSKQVHHLGTDPITACAGVAIVPHHAPFVRAYELSESLCQSAKRAARNLDKQTQRKSSFLDWHVGLPKPSQSLTQLREREYQVARPESSTLAPNQPSQMSEPEKQAAKHESNHLLLTCRPYRLGTGADDPESWQWLDQTLLDHPLHGLRGKIWSSRRNKAKELREILRGGPAGVSAALQRWHVVFPKLKLVNPINADGFFNVTTIQPVDEMQTTPLEKKPAPPVEKTRTPLLDALELLDLHIPLDPIPQAAIPKAGANPLQQEVTA